MKKFLSTALASLALAVGACAPAQQAPLTNVSLLSDEGKEVVVPVELALTQADRTRGLMGRTELSEGTGMLFVFPDEKPRAFWMKNTLIPLDVLYFRADGSFVSFSTMQPCVADPCATYSSGGAAAYALEVPAGTAKEWKVRDGWSLETRGH